MPPTDDTTPPAHRPRRPAFPWLSSLAGLALAAVLIAAGEPGLLHEWGAMPEGYRLHPLLTTREFKLSAVLVLVLILLWEVYRHHRRLRVFSRDIRQLRTELNQVWESKKQLQMKAHTYAGHADKLKLFISEKLLEYIEYDEKFLHFKSIAAEVRHNGVIAFDKVQTALEAHLEHEQDDEPARARDRDAHAAMRYLWDLLDLSTADNIALHIGNQLCECEEHYYQRLLNDAPSAAVPHRPDYSPRRACLRALAPLLQDSPARLEALDDTAEGRVVLDEDPQFRAYLENTDTLLGNENHFVLMLENLLKNAQFFARKKPRSRHHRVALTLGQNNARVELAVYNRGPHIDPDSREQIFQLGYSTRRAREHHGKGLGLFFVQEIIKGYEGRIQVENIDNRGAFYSLRIALDDGQVRTDVIEVTLDEQGQPRCRRARSEDTDPGGEQLDWEFDQPIARVELTPGDDPEPLTLEADTARGRDRLRDPRQPAVPRWALELHNRRKGGKLTFRPLDVAGVCFRVRLPTAASRLDGDDEDPESLAPSVEALNRPFEAMTAYPGDEHRP